MTKLVNRAKVATATTGTGTISLSGAVDGYQTFADAGVADGDVVRYVIEDGNNWEIGTGIYSATGPTLTRTVSESSDAGSAINLSGGAVVFVSAVAEDFLAGWTDFATQWDTPPTLNAAIASGSVYDYTLNGVTRYRFVSSPYLATADAFYSVFNEGSLSGYIVGRTSVPPPTYPVTRAQLDEAIDGSTFAVTDGGYTYTLEDGPLTVDTSNVTDMVSLFSSSAFNGNINYWDVSAVTRMNGMFSSATSFDQPLDSWDVSAVTNMNGMFFSATSFDQPLDSWDVSAVTRMNSVFRLATSFNQPLDSWDVSAVTDMGSMFSSATSFDQPLDSWDVSAVTNMGSMFSSATSFDQPLDSWDVSAVTNMGSMFSGSGLSVTNYSRTLIGWANRAYNGGANNGVQPNVSLGAAGRQYDATTHSDAWPNLPGQQFTDAVSARAYLVGTMGWTITDGGQA